MTYPFIESDGSITTRIVEELNTLNIINVSPTGVLSTDVPSTGVDEGTATGIYRVSIDSVFDPASGDSFTYSFDFGNDGSFEVIDVSSSSAPIPAEALLADGPLTVRGIVSDQDGGSSEYTTTFIVNDVAPVIALSGEESAQEGSVYELSISFSDSGTTDGDITFYIDWDDGTAIEEVSSAGRTSPITVQHTFQDDSDALTISVTAEDDKGTYDSFTKVVDVANVDPVLADTLVAKNDSGISLVIEGDTVALTGSFTDAGEKDSFRLVVNWGDNTGDDERPLDVGATDFRVVHEYKNDGSYTIEATLFDDDGGTSETRSVVILVNNGVPVVAYTFDPSPVDEGTTVSLTGFITDPGVVDTHSILIEWGDGNTSAPTVVNGTFSATHVYADDNPTSTTGDDFDIVVTATDQADPFSTGDNTQTITVNNVAPNLFEPLSNATTIATAKAIGEAVTVTATFEDPAGVSDIYTATIDWGDGTTTTANGTYDSTTGFGTVTATRAYSARDIYDIEIYVEDDDGGLSLTESTFAVVGDYTNTVPVVDDQTFSVDENSTTGTVVGTLAATDDGALTYQLTELPKLLAMTATSDGPVDGLPAEDVALAITINSGLPSETSLTIDLLLSDADLADNTTLGDLASDINSRIAAAGIGGLLRASADGDINGNEVLGKLSIGGVDDSVIRLSITGGESLGFEATQNAGKGEPTEAPEFTIDPDTGEITVNEELLDAETTQSFTLLATVTDFWGASDTALVTIHVNDLSEFAPHLQLPAAVFEVDEFSVNGTVITTAIVTDDDIADSIAFSLEPVDTPFTIDEITGVISVSDSSALDFDITPQFEITVIATDAGGLTDERDITINLLELTRLDQGLLSETRATSSAWTSSEFLAEIDPSKQTGYVLGDARDTRQAIPWAGIDRLVVTFAEDVSNRFDNFEFVVKGINVPEYALAELPQYDPSNQSATLKLASTIDADRLCLCIRDSANGDSFSMSFGVLPGDINGDGTVSVTDVGFLRNSLGFFVGDTSYTAFADMDANGVISVSDIGPLRSSLGQFLPDGDACSSSTNWVRVGDANYDVSRDGFLSPIDVLLIVNQLNRSSENGEGEGEDWSNNLDVNTDGVISPIDALLLINELNRQKTAFDDFGNGGAPLAEGEGESDAAFAALHFELGEMVDLSWLEEENRKRRGGAR
ncbi:MAG TPA: hypothetical protein DDW52_28910 [Planctomycetaceae bacterium]|nr:hypothetical protein [Planctomycetaceae bacterium]